MERTTCRLDHTVRNPVALEKPPLLCTVSMSTECIAQLENAAFGKALIEKIQLEYAVYMTCVKL